MITPAPLVAWDNAADDAGGGGTSMPLEPLHTSPPPALDGTFPCLRYGTLTHRACLRRQVERREPARPGVQGPPVKPYCAESCAQGREVAALFPALVVRACPACGTGLVGEASCPTCAAREAQKRPPKVLPPPVRSEAVWAPQPDVPFVPPGAQRPGSVPQLRPAARPPAVRLVPPAAETPSDRFAAADAVRRAELDAALRGGACVVCGAHKNADGVCSDGACRRAQEKAALAALEFAAHPVAYVSERGVPVPVLGREEEVGTMAIAKVCKNCKKNPLRSDNTSGICSACRKAPAKGRAVAGEAPAAAPAARPLEAARQVRSPRSERHPELATMKVEDLVALRGQVDEELERRETKAQEQLEAIRKARGSA